MIGLELKTFQENAVTFSWIELQIKRTKNYSTKSSWKWQNNNFNSIY